MSKSSFSFKEMIWTTIKNNDDALNAALQAKVIAYIFCGMPIFILGLKFLFDVHLYPEELWDITMYIIVAIQVIIMFLFARIISSKKLWPVPVIFVWCCLEVAFEPKPISIFLLLASFNCLRGYLKLKKISKEFKKS